jgi:PD-(D/E)XK nuclease superfamily protein
MEHPKAKGDRSVLAIMLALNEAGYALLVPFGENTRYDLVIDDGSRLSRVQCKTGRLRSGAVTFNVCSTYAHHPNPRVVRRDYHGQVDYFAVFCPDNRRAYLIPIAELPLRKQGRLRVDPPRNNQRLGIRFAADFEIGELSPGLGETTSR